MFLIGLELYLKECLLMLECIPSGVLFCQAPYPSGVLIRQASCRICYPASKRFDLSSSRGFQIP